MKLRFSLCVLLVSGCADGYPRVVFTPSSTMPTRPAKQAAQVSIVMDPDEPKCKYEIVGVFDTRRGGGLSMVDVADSRSMMRGEAARMGLDGIMSVDCAKPGTVGFTEGLCTGKGYVCK